MIGKSILLLLPLLVATSSFVKGELVPVSKYIGEHNNKCSYGMKITGSRVENKLYTFGGCYPIPYMVDPLDDVDDPFGMASIMGMSKDRVNVSNYIQIYDLDKDQWTNEESAKTPVPWRKAQLQVVNHDIYAFNINSRPATRKVAFWKYNTDEKIWSQLSDLPFIWINYLRSCRRAEKIYFSGSDDGEYRNIIQVYDTTISQWEKPIFLNETLNNIASMICGEKYIHFVAKQAKLLDEDNVQWFSTDDQDGEVKKQTFGVFSSEYDSGLTILSQNITGNFKAIISNDDVFFFYDVGKTDATIIEFDTIKNENATIGTIPATLENPLIIPYLDNQVFIFGGGERKRFGRAANRKIVENPSRIKTYNHKLIASIDNEGNKDIKNAAFASQEQEQKFSNPFLN